MAQEFSSELDAIFNLTGGLDTLVGDVETKRQSIFVQQQELELLEELLDQAEQRLGSLPLPTSERPDEAEESCDEGESGDNRHGAADALAALEGRPRSNTSGPGLTPLAPPPLSAMSRSRSIRFSQPSIFAIRETEENDHAAGEEEAPRPTRAPTAVPAPRPQSKREFVLMKRRRGPLAAGKKDGRVDSHIEVTTEEEETQDDNDNEEPSDGERR